MKLVSFLPVQDSFVQYVTTVRELCICLTVRIRHSYLCSQKVLKYADTNVIEFQSSRGSILMKIHANISSSILKCLYHVSQLLLYDPSDLDSRFDFMNFVSVDFLF